MCYKHLEIDFIQCAKVHSSKAHHRFESIVPQRDQISLVQVNSAVAWSKNQILPMRNLYLLVLRGNSLETGVTSAVRILCWDFVVAFKVQA